MKRKNKRKHRINREIKSQEVRLVGEGIEQGVYSIQESMIIANEMGLDLVEISPNANPPVCKVMDYSKFLYEQKKREKENKQKNKTETKELRFGPNTDDHDFEFKLKHAKSFLEKGARLRAFVFFKGREISFKDKGKLILLKLAQALADHGKVIQMPQMEGRKMIMFIGPKKK